MHQASLTSRDKGTGLTPAVTAVIATILRESPNASEDYFLHERIGIVYRSYMISQVLDPPEVSDVHRVRFPGEAAARVLSEFGLAEESAGKWIQLYEHICGVTAAAVTIARRMKLSPHDCEKVRIAALLHDATKRRDVEKYGVLASSQCNENNLLEQSMRKAEYPQDVISAATNTGRADRKFSSTRDMQHSIAGKGIIAAIVSLADARTPTASGADFLSLAEARELYLKRKSDQESQEYFINYWYAYYLNVEEFLKEERPEVDLAIKNREIYYETIFPDVFGSNPSENICSQYSYGL